MHILEGAVHSTLGAGATPAAEVVILLLLFVLIPEIPKVPFHTERSGFRTVGASNALGHLAFHRLGWLGLILLVL
jgi:hypothetical protein